MATGFGVFEEVDPATVDDAIFHLLYQQHGGSGLSLTLADVEELEWARMLRFIEQLGETRKKEAAAISRAQKGG